GRPAANREDAAIAACPVAVPPDRAGGHARARSPVQNGWQSRLLRPNRPCRRRSLRPAGRSFEVTLWFPQRVGVAVMRVRSPLRCDVSTAKACYDRSVAMRIVVAATINTALSQLVPKPA